MLGVKEASQLETPMDTHKSNPNKSLLCLAKGQEESV